MAGLQSQTCGLPSLLARCDLQGRSVHSDRGLRHIPSGEVRTSLARSSGHRDRPKRNQYPVHGTTEAQVQAEQSPGPPTLDRPHRGVEEHLRPDRLHGVLHHLEDPDAGLAALRDVLKPEGALHLMLYAPYGRAGIYMLQEFCRKLGIHATDAEIRDLIAALRLLPPGHPLETLLRVAPDFQHEAALADALLHPQDRAYSVPQFFAFLGRANLKFGRWTKQAPYSAHCGVMAHIPQNSRLTKLSMPDQHAAVELFRGTMVRHSAIVYRDHAATSSSQLITFTGTAWMQYVPLRMPETVCILERLPPGASAVLINRTHTYTDLYLPINAFEKRLYDAIDGSHSIDAILQATLTPSQSEEQIDLARAFFERLWWWDQVVFDTSAIQTTLLHSDDGRISLHRT